jgi:hypothetical protein
MLGSRERSRAGVGVEQAIGIYAAFCQAIRSLAWAFSGYSPDDLTHRRATSVI